MDRFIKSFIFYSRRFRSWIWKRHILTQALSVIALQVFLLSIQFLAAFEIFEACMIIAADGSALGGVAESWWNPIIGGIIGVVLPLFMFVPPTIMLFSAMDDWLNTTRMAERLGSFMRRNIWEPMQKRREAKKERKEKSWKVRRDYYQQAWRESFDPTRETPDDIDMEPNIERRRAMIEEYENHHGIASYIIDSGIQPVHKDEWGELYKKEVGDGVVLARVKVLNATQEDGKNKVYYLKVPHRMQTAKEAVAWTFSKEEDDYHPLIES